MRDSFAAATRNLISQLGSALALVSGVLIITLVAIELFGFEANPYVGIITYMVLPTVFALGLVLIVWGIVRERKRAPGGRFPVIDLNVKRTRQLVLSFLVILSMCVVILATGTSGAIHFMESNTFCGTMCHTVMSPQYTAFQRSPHASVHCVDCHVAPGAGGFVDAKINGKRLKTILDSGSELNLITKAAAREAGLDVIPCKKTLIWMAKEILVIYHRI